jgi:YD repeat-containing protein
MKRKKTYLFVFSTAFFLNFGALKVQAQNVPQNLVSLPPTPQASSLFKFLETPVSENTGIPNISIPIYTINLKSFSFPISLKYHSSGAKVEEQSGNIGLGWAIEAGGTISSSINDLPDFSVNSPYADFPQDRELRPEKVQVGTTFQENSDYTQLMNLMGNPIFYGSTSGQTQRADLQPDMFYYSMFEKAGKFFFTKDGFAHTIPHSRLIIEKNATVGYRIKDERGVMYIYDVAENIYSNSVTFSNHAEMGGGSTSVLSASYHLSSIVTPTNDVITITYKTQNYSYVSYPSFTRYRTLPGPLFCANIDGETHTETTTTVSGKFIDEIISNKGHKVKFIYADCQRLDMPGTYPLKRIDIYLNDAIKSVEMVQEYFGLETFNCNTQVNSSSVKLKLKRIKEQSKGDYVFDYYGGIMPDRFSFVTDHWGYYNGVGGLFAAAPEYGFSTGSDKSPNLEYTKIGVLNKITYPTGGYTVFEHELNRFPDQVSVGGTLGEQKDASVYFTNYTNEPVRRYVNFTIPNNVEPGSIVAFWQCTDGTYNPQFSVSLYNSDYTYNRGFGGISPAMGEGLSLYPGNYTIDVYEYGLYEEGNFRVLWKEKPVPGTTEIRDVDGGGLRIKSIKDFDFGSDSPKLSKSYTYTKSSNPALSSGEIFGKPLYTTIYDKYNYNINQDNNSSLDEHLCRYYLQSSKSKLPLTGGQFGNVVYTEVQKYVQGSAGTNNGYTNNTYSFFKDYKPYYMYPFTPSTSYEWMSGYLTKSEIYGKNDTGYVLKRRVKNQYNFNYTPPDYTQNPSESGGHYTPPNKPNEAHAIGLNVIVDRPEYVIGAGRYPAKFTIESFKLISSWVYLQSSTEDIFEQDIPQISLVTNNYYDNPLHSQLTRSTTSNSKGGFNGKLYTYAYDYPSGIPFIDDLKSNNLVTAPIESISYKIDAELNWDIISGEISEYRSGGKGLIENIYSLETNEALPLSGFKISNAGTGSVITSGSPIMYQKDNRYVKKMNVSQYDDANNITQINTKVDGNDITNIRDVKISYLWGYEKQHVIAEVQNAASDEFFYENFESNGQIGKSHTGAKLWNGSYVVNWSRPNNRNYEISYWYLNNNQWFLKKEMYTGNSAQLSGGTAYDDVRIYPSDAQMINYTYDPLVGMTSSTDAKGMTTYYEYDAFQRLKAIKDQNGNILKQTDYHYKN